VMVPVIPDTYSALLGTSAATSITMPVPRGNLNSQSRGVLHETFSARAAGKLEQLGMCHEGPTTRASTVKPGHHSIDGEWAREEEERQGRHRGPRRCTVFLEQNQQVQK
jgi:hypothetical protein